LDYLDKFDFPKILTALEDEIQASKRAIEETTKIEMVRIQNFEELLGSPDQHIKSMKDANEKLLQAENQLVAAEAERKKLIVENADKLLQCENQLLAADAERKKLVVEKDILVKETSEKLV
jgi:hypothetical protein